MKDIDGKTLHQNPPHAHTDSQDNIHGYVRFGAFFTIVVSTRFDLDMDDFSIVMN